MQSLSIFIIRSLCSLLFFHSLVFAEDVVVESLEGEAYILQVDQQDRFLDVVYSIQECLASEGQERELSGWDSFKMFFLRNRASTEYLSKSTKIEARSYEAGVTPAQAADIAYIVKTLANSSLPKIKSAESSLKKAGERIDIVHPLQFLSCIFSNEELKVCLRNLQGRTWVWKDFLGGLTDTLAEENARGNVAPYLSDFAQKAHVNATELNPSAQAGNWKRFVNKLIELAPRAPGSDRYSM